MTRSRVACALYEDCQQGDELHDYRCPASGFNNPRWEVNADGSFTDLHARADGEVERVMESIRHRTTIRHGDERIVEAVLRSLADYTLIGDAIKYGDGDDPAHRVCRLMHRLADGAR